MVSKTFYTFDTSRPKTISADGFCNGLHPASHKMSKISLYLLDGQ